MLSLSYFFLLVLLSSYRDSFSDSLSRPLAEGDNGAVDDSEGVNADHDVELQAANVLLELNTAAVFEQVIELEVRFDLWQR